MNPEIADQDERSSLVKTQPKEAFVFLKPITTRGEVDLEIMDIIEEDQCIKFALRNVNAYSKSSLDPSLLGQYYTYSSLDPE